MKVALLGISIDFKTLGENADSLIRFKREPVSNVTDSSDLHAQKLSFPEKTTDDARVRYPFE
jgi:hypothetical protein